MTKLTEKQIKLLASKKNWILDVDGCSYPRDKEKCGYYQQLSKNVKKSFINILLNRKEFKGALKLAGEALLEHPEFFSVIFKGFAKASKELLVSKITKKSDSFDKVEEVYDSIVPMVKLVRDKHPEEVYHFANAMYGNDYDMIKEDFNFVSAVRKAEKKNVQVNFYTRSPSYKDKSEYAHVQHVMHSLGFAPEEIEDYRSKTYDLFDAVDDGSIGKPTAESMSSFIDFAKIKNPEDAVMFDDNIKNLRTAALFGITPVWTWTSDKKPSKQEREIAEEIGAIMVRKTGKALKAIINAM